MAQSLWSDLVERRVPHVLAAYLGGSWVAIEFMAFLEDRFFLSPHATNVVLLILVLLLPSVLLFTYFHGRKGRDRWTRLEKVFIPLNMAVALVAVLAGFAGKELGTMTTTLTVEDPEGNAVERVVPKSEFRKRAAFFPLEVVDGDTSSAWLGSGAAAALVTDLFQEMFLDARPPATFQEELRAAGFPDGRSVPDPLKRRIARELHLRHYVDGEIEREGDGYRLAVALHDTDRARIVADREFRGADLFALIDSATIQLRHDLEIPARHIEESADAPVAEILTGSVEALREYTDAVERIRVDADYQGALGALARAVAEDSTFAMAQFARYQVFLLSGDPAAGAGAIRDAMTNIYRLPERLEYAVKAEWFLMQQDLPRSFATYEMWAELYPQDIEAQLTVARIRQTQNDRRGAIDALEHVLELDPTQLELLPEIGTLYEALGEPERALDYFTRYAEANPDDRSSFIQLAGVHHRQGSHERARSLYDQAMLLAPADVELLVELATLDRNVGAFDRAEAGFGAALEAATTPDERFRSLRGLALYHEYRGAMDRAVEFQEQAMEAAREYQAPITVVQRQLIGLDMYIEAGRADEALERLAELSTQLPPPLDAMVPVGEIQVWEAMGEPDSLEAAVAAGEAMLERLGVNALAQPVKWGEGRVHELRGEWQEAIAAYEEELRLNPIDPTIPLQLGRCHRQLGSLDRAMDYVQRTLDMRPSYAPAHVEMARILRELGRDVEAAEHLEAALRTWAPADSAYGPARDARALLSVRPVGG